MNKLVDQIEKKDKERQEDSAVSSIKSIGDLSFDDLQAIPQKAADMAHPFDGYPYEKVKIGTDEKGKDIEVMSAFLVMLFPAFQPPQDVSGVGVTIRREKKNIKGDILSRVEEQVTIKTTHNVIIVDYDNAKVNVDVVFDREFELSGGKKILGAVVPSHSIRAQLMFEYDPIKKRVFATKKYVLVDVRQANKLRKIFDIVMFSKLRSEKLANKHYEDEGD